MRDKGMGGTPARHHSKSRRNKGRAHFALKPAALRPCGHCGALMLPHRMCANCGYYKGTQIIDVLAKLDKKERKKREKVLREQEATEQEQQ